MFCIDITLKKEDNNIKNITRMKETKNSASKLESENQNEETNSNSDSADNKQAEENAEKTAAEEESPENSETDSAKTQENTDINSEETFEEKYNKLNDKYLRLAAEYDNYRKRTLKEKMDLIKNAGEDILSNFLPILDNMDRAKKSIDETSDIDSVKEGITLIHKNLKDFISSRGVKEIEATGKDFDTDLHEAVTKIPAPDKKLKGKVIDVIEKGYRLNDKIIRYAKVVVGE
jgi:molecular chaperone GrpE